MKTLLIATALTAMFITLAGVLFAPGDSYAREVKMENQGWCRQVLSDHAKAGDTIPSEIVKMCARELTN